MLFDKVIVFDNYRQKLILIAGVSLTGDLEENCRRAERELDEMERLIRSRAKADFRPLVLKEEFRPAKEKEEYAAMVERAKEYIREGDIFQVVLSNPMTAEAEGSLFDTYRVLRTTNPSPYMFYFSSDDIEAAGASPETLAKMAGGRLFTFPLAGTRPRGKTKEEDQAGRGVDTAETAATIATGKLGIFHGMKSYFCQDEYGQIAPVYSISAGLDYPGVGPEHADLYDRGRAEYVAVTDDEAVDAFEYLARTEGIIPAIESAHAVAYARKLAPQMDRDQIMVINISGRGDKDCAAIARYRGEDIYE